MVGTVGHCLNEGWRSQAAGLAQSFRVFSGYREARNTQIFSATGAETSGLRAYVGAARVAERGAGKAQEGAATKGAGSRKQYTGEVVGGTSQHTNHSPPNRSLRHRDVECQGNTLT